MRITLTLAILLLSSLVSAMPDYLYNVELARQNAFGLMLSDGVEYYHANRDFDSQGKSTKMTDIDARYNYLLFIVKMGYHLPNPDWSVFIDLPIIAQNSVAGADQITKHDLGLANPYLVGRWIPYLGGGLRLGPRLGLRFAGLSKTVKGATSATSIPSGDDSWGFDLGVLCSSRSEQSAFRLDANAGLRYLFPAQYKLSAMGITMFDYRETPPISVRGEIAPGIHWHKHWTTYIKGYGNYDLTKGKVHDNTYDTDTEADKTGLLGVGFRQTCEINPANELGIEFHYDLKAWGRNAGWHLTRFYVGYIPM